MRFQYLPALSLKNFVFQVENMVLVQSLRGLQPEYILNDGTMTQEAYEELTRKAAQSFNNCDMEKERRQAEAAEL